jgi:hypothetical protein
MAEGSASEGVTDGRNDRSTDPVDAHPSARERRARAAIASKVLAWIVGLATAGGAVAAVVSAVAPFVSDGGTDEAVPAEQSAKGPRLIPVPDVRGGQLGPAKEAIQAAGLDYRIRKVCSPRPSGRVIRQQPKGQVVQGTVISVSASRGPYADIRRPKSGVVRHRYSVEGKVCGIPDSKNLWIAVQTGAGLSPKTPELHPDRDGGFGISVQDPSSIPEGFSVVLLLVGSRGETAIERWLEEGRQTGRYPPLDDEDIPGNIRLDAVSRLVFKA